MHNRTLCFNCLRVSCLGIVCLLASSCSDESSFCNEMGCTNRVDVILDPPLLVTSPVTVQFRLGGETHSCELAAPAVGSSQDAIQGACGVRIGLNNPEVRWENGNRLSGFLLDLYYPPPGQIFVSIRDGETILRSGLLSLGYAWWSPNGEDCPPVCGHAMAILAE